VFDKRRKWEGKLVAPRGFLPWLTKLQSPQFGEKIEKKKNPLEETELPPYAFYN